MSMLFLDEIPLKPEAFRWAQESSRTQREIPAVVALYDERATPVYVGTFDDAVFAVAALCRKHGRGEISSLRYETFPPEVLSDPMGVAMMGGLARSWLEQATDEIGAQPRGNADASWAQFDRASNPFLFGILGEGATPGEDDGFLSEEEAADEKLQRRRENMKKNLDDAVLQGNEKLATTLLRRLANLSDDLAGEDETPLS